MEEMNDEARKEVDTIRTVVFRQSRDENTVAILSCKRTSNICNSYDFRDALFKAVTDWVDRTTDGRKAYADSCNDFNLGDLYVWNDNPTLRTFMELHGITDFEIEVFCEGEPVQEWTYDTHLVDEDRVNRLD